MSLLDRIRAWREFAVTAVMWSEPRKAGYIQAVADCARTVEQWEHQWLSILADRDRLRDENAHEKLKANEAMAAFFALSDWTKEKGYTFADWSDTVKQAFSDAIIDKRPLTEDDIKWARQVLASRPASPPAEPPTLEPDPV